MAGTRGRAVLPLVSVTLSGENVAGVESQEYPSLELVQVDATAPFTPIPSQYLLGSVFQITLRGGSLLVIQR